MYLPDVPVSVLFGSLIALSLRGAATDSAAHRRLCTRQAMAYGMLFHCPDSIFAYIWYPDWNLGYFVAPQTLGWGGMLASEVVLLLLLVGGASVTAKLEAQRRNAGWVVPATAALVFAGIMAGIWDRYLHVGTMAQYHAGTAVRGATDPTFVMFSTLAGMYLVVPLLVLLGNNLFGAKFR